MLEGGRLIDRRPALPFSQLWNISFGFFGIQIGFALQNANASRIFQSLGTPIDGLGLMWIAAPLTGLIVQPLVGHYSDRTWGRLGRRRPYFLAGALLSMLALFIMPNAPAIWVAALTLWLLDASLNISMEPFRAFVGDMLPVRQRPAGYAFQTAFIGAGAVAASLAPWVLEHWFGVSNAAPPGQVPDAVRIAMYFGGAVLFLAVLWTVIFTREYPPEMLGGRPASAAFDHDLVVATPNGPRWIAGGLVMAALIWVAGRSGYLATAQEAYLVAAGLAAFGIAQMGSRVLVSTGRGDNVLSHIVSDLATMPVTMRQLALVQFLTWGALIIMWVYATPVVAQRAFGTLDPASATYNEAASWVGILFAVYSGIAALAAFLLPLVAGRIGPARTHFAGLLCGAVAFVGLALARDQNALILPMIGIGIAWASILSMPYVILANALPPGKLGVYMGLFNFFVVLPQLLVATIMGGVIRVYFPTQPVWTMAVAAVLMASAALAMLRVRTP